MLLINVLSCLFPLHLFSWGSGETREESLSWLATQDPEMVKAQPLARDDNKINKYCNISITVKQHKGTYIVVYHVVLICKSTTSS